MLQSFTPLDERLLHHRLTNTVWEPGRLQHFPSLVSTGQGDPGAAWPLPAMRARAWDA